jgi:acyl dehydratase
MPPMPLRLAELDTRVGEEIGVSPWLAVDQQRIGLFAQAIDDRQWIHVDPVRAKTGPFGAAIAHGFLTLSLLSHLFASTFSFEDATTGINYGLDRVRFTAPLPAGSRIRARFVLRGFERLDGGGIQSAWNVVVEREGGGKPVLVAEWLLRNH